MTGATGSDASQARAQRRAELFVHAVLPLLEPIAAAEPQRRSTVRAPALAYIGLSGSSLGAALRFDGMQLRVVPLTGTDAGVALGSADVTIVFRDATQLNRFFSGRACWPTVRGGLRRPGLLAAVLRLLSALRVLEPGQALPATCDARALRVRVLLLLVARALAHEARRGVGELAEWAAQDGERVFQWSAGPEGEDPDHVAVFIRTGNGRVQAGRGVYRQRRPFVHFAFRDTDAALRMLTSPDSQMTGLRDGLLRTIGSPEYTRKVALQMQHVDQLLLEG